ncbi:hypothetical protein [Pedobacter insulae]|uniref:DUF748 domain-containing protein n=1 Tax=Pedobacter insulae TaxID=414048 RepID=A0A1I2TFS2_9SPHI|nr:hypothetical protein [Pedobacter insulae]SFG61131.1 hypothetical protein SAMN04489864_101251 [Pedobacter insulae]
MSDRKIGVRLLKWVLGIVLFGLLSAVAASWYISVKLKPLIRKEISELVNKSTNGLYRIEFTTIHTNFVTGSASIADVKIIPDTGVFKTLIAQKKAPNNLYYISLKNLSIKRFHPLAMYFNKEAKIDLILFDKPNVTMVNKHFEFNENRPPRPRRSPYDYISKLFKSLRIDLVNFRDANFKYVNNNDSIPEIDSVANLNVTLKDWLIDEQSSDDTSRLYLLKDIAINVNNYTYATPDSMYFLKLEQLDFSASSRKLNIKQFALEPRYSTADFAKVNGYARDRFTVKLNNLALDGLDLPAYIQKQELIAQQMHITDGLVSVYNDNSYPKREVNKTGKFPHQLLQALRAKLNIKKINLNNIDVSFAEFDRDSKQIGKLSFEKTSGVILNATNMPRVETQNPMMTANLESYMMGQGKLVVTFNFDLNSPVGAFDYQGALTNLDGKTLNQITKPLGMVLVKKGEIRKLDFAIKADENVAKGKVNFTYNDLSVALMKKEEGKERLVRQGLISFLANNLIIYSDNPSIDGKFTSATIHYKREITASFFNYIWKTLFQGVKYSVGVTPQKEAEIKAQIAKFEQMKSDRDERRFRRQLRKNKKVGP